jgi:hypothetical protein
MPSQGAKKPGHQAEGTPGFFVAYLLQESEKSWRLGILLLCCRNCFLHCGGDAVEHRGVDGAENLTEDNQVSKAANGVRFFHRVDREFYDFVALGKYAMKHIKHVGVAQVLK